MFRSWRIAISRCGRVRRWRRSAKARPGVAFRLEPSARLHVANRQCGQGRERPQARGETGVARARSSRGNGGRSADGGPVSGSDPPVRFRDRSRRAGRTPVRTSCRRAAATRSGSRIGLQQRRPAILKSRRGSLRRHRAATVHPPPPAAAARPATLPASSSSKRSRHQASLIAAKRRLRRRGDDVAHRIVDVEQGVECGPQLDRPVEPDEVAVASSVRQR